MARRIALFVVLLVSALASAQERIRDVIYMKQAGVAFTLDVFKPKAPNGAAVVYLVSGGWYSAHENINVPFADALTKEGFTVFEVVHGAQPRYKIPEIHKQITRAVRFVKANASTYGIDPARIGITGGSAGGHLSLMTAGKADAGDPNAADPIEKQPSTVAAVVAIFPPTDFTNYNGQNANQLFKSTFIAPFRGAFGVPPNPTPEQIDAIAKETSPIRTITAAFPPTLLIHGDKDILVPLQQSEIFRDALKKAGVATELMVVPGGGHDGVTTGKGLPRLISWFKEKLASKTG
jgi:acetyl esterase/lipase